MRLLKNALGVGAVTLASRLLGFLRDALIAAVLGSGPVADAFVVALRLPNLFRRLFAEGAFAAAFVPGFIALRDAEGEVSARRFAGMAGVLLAGTVAAVVLAVEIWTRPVVLLLAPGWRDDAAKLDLAIDLTRLTFPYLAGVTVVALFAGLLASRRRFFAAAAAPVFFNLMLMAVVVALLVEKIPAGTFAGRVLAATVAVSGVVQALFLLAVVVHEEILPLPARPSATPALRRFGRALLPGLIAGGLVEINIVISTMIASIEPGAVAWLYYADRLHQLPLGLVGIAIGQVLLPEIAEESVRSDGAVHATQNRALEFALVLALPAALGLFLLAEPIVDVLFRRGAFTAADVVESSRALAVFALGLPAVVATRVFSAAHFGRGDTRTPMNVGIVAVAVNVALALALRPFVGWIAVAHATVAAAWLGAALLIGLLVRRDRWRVDAAFRRRLPRIVLAAAGMAAVVAAMRLFVVDSVFATGGAGARVAVLAAAVGVGVAVHAGLVVAFGVIDRKAFVRRALRAGPADGDATCEAGRDRA